MRKLGPMYCALAVVTLLTSSAALPARADWPSHGLLLTTAAAASPAAVADGAGGVFVVWLDNARGLVAQHVQADGSLASGWPAGGTAIGPALGDAPGVVADGAGGVLMLWVAPTSPPATGTGLIRMQRMDAGGSVHAGWPTGGLVINNDLLNYKARVFAVESDGENGAYLAWSRFDPAGGSREDLRLTRVTVDGAIAPGWELEGVTLGYDPASLSLAADPTGGVVVAAFVGTGGLFARVGPDAVTTFSTTIAMPATPPLIVPDAVPDGSGGIIADWWWSSNLYSSSGGTAQHFTSSGLETWAPRPLVGMAGRCVADGSGGAWIVGLVFDQNLYMTHLATDGTVAPGWTAFGSHLSGTYYYFQVARVGSDALVCWVEPTFSISQEQVVAARITPAGISANGPLKQVLSDADVISSPALVSDGTGGGFATWAVQPGIVVNRVHPDATVGVAPLAAPTALAIRGSAPNPARDAVDIAFSLGGARRAELALVDVTGRVRVRQEVAGADAGHVRLSLTGLPSGIYWARLGQAGHTVSRRFAVVR
jgi:hypothetical protein